MTDLSDAQLEEQSSVFRSWLSGLEGTEHSIAPHAIGKGVHAVIRFPNGYGASIILTPYSYGVELAPVHWEDGETDLDAYYLVNLEQFPGGTVGWLDPQGLAEAMNVIAALEPYRKGLTDL